MAGQEEKSTHVATGARPGFSLKAPQGRICDFIFLNKIPEAVEISDEIQENTKIERSWAAGSAGELLPGLLVLSTAPGTLLALPCTPGSKRADGSTRLMCNARPAWSAMLRPQTPRF